MVYCSVCEYVISPNGECGCVPGDFKTRGDNVHSNVHKMSSLAYCDVQDILSEEEAQ